MASADLQTWAGNAIIAVSLQPYESVAEEYRAESDIDVLLLSGCALIAHRRIESVSLVTLRERAFVSISAGSSGAELILSMRASAAGSVLLGVIGGGVAA